MMELGLNMETIQEILRDYNEEAEDIGGGLELNEGQRGYLKGYMDGMRKNEVNIPEDDLMQEQINNVRSKYCEPILDLLEEEGELYHGDLSEKTNLSLSGLNAVIKKMQESTIPLIHTSQIGKYKIYSLSDEIKGYMKRKRQRHFPASPSACEKKEPSFLLLQRFVEKAGSDWREVLGMLLQGEEEGYPPETVDCFQRLMAGLIEIQEDNTENLDGFKAFLGNEVLIYLLEDYVKTSNHYKDKIVRLMGEDNSKRNIRIIKQTVNKME